MLKRLPAADVEAMREAQGERADLVRQKIWAEISGRRDSSGKVVLPTTEQLNDLMDRALKIDRARGDPFRTRRAGQVCNRFCGRGPSAEEIDIRLARLTPPAEQNAFMKLVAKMEGRWVEPVAIEDGSIETTATAVKPKPR